MPAALDAQDGRCVESVAQTLAGKRQARLAAYLASRTKVGAERVYETFQATYDIEYPNAVACLVKDRET